MIKFKVMYNLDKSISKHKKAPHNGAIKPNLINKLGFLT